jgi:hypothetical protein
MSNMSYCRFHNTLNDLRDCYKHMDDQPEEDEVEDIEELEARRDLIELCKDIVRIYGDM